METYDAIAKVGTFLDLLTSVGLTINRDKTIALLKLHGPGKAKIYKRFIKKTRDGHFICIPSKHGQPYLIRLVSQISYLGVILNYTNFELLTMRHRIKAGIKVSQQLQRWIFVKTGLSRRQKIKLWFQCIFPCLVYGLRSTGITAQTAIMLDRIFMQQLRRLCHSPVHLTHLNHVDFLEWAGAADPLLRLLHQYQKAQQRDHQRCHMLQEDDIVHTCRPCVTSPEQVLLEIFEQRRLSSTLGEAEYNPFDCDLCTRSFTTMAQLRRHQALIHGRRTGLLRPYHESDSHDGVPTCKRCELIFTTWHRLQYHVKYVCIANTQEDEDAEYRLRVREYLHYVQGMSFVALGQRQDLTAYFSHRCILCGKFLLTQRGVLHHWGDDHNDTFRQHGVWNSFLQQHAGPSNPCEFCGTHFQREHCCVAIRQYAMYMTFHGQVPPQAGPSPPTAFPCPSCSKVFLTKHGLEQHLRNFHSALQVGNHLTDLQIDAYCLVMQAVENEACRDLLGHEHIVELLSHVCLLCQKIFQRKNELVRHFKSHHSSLWNQTVIEAEKLEQVLKPSSVCYCLPKVYNRKHQCMLTLQYALLRLTAVPGPDAELARSTPPDLLLSTAEVVRQLAWLGLLRLLMHNPALKMSLSLHCQVCASHFTSPTLLMGHMRAIHGQAIMDATAWIRMLTWVLFSAHGCMCNPAVNHGTPGHACPLIYNLALMINDDATGIVVPWHYRATDLMDVLEPLVTEPVLSKVTTLMMTRRFEDVMLSTEVYQLLTQRCLLCDIVIPLNCARTHIRVAHNFDLKCLEVIIDQLAACAAQTHFDHWCTFCGQLLPYDLHDDNLTPCPEQHLKECDYIALVAMLLSYPVWYKKPYMPDEWPTVDEVERGSHETHLQLMQFNALPSDQMDALGKSYEQLAACGFFMMSDPKFHERLSYQCLMCERRFFSPWRMFEHLQSHNYRQLDTFMCSHRLHLRCQQPCQFCTLPQHLAPLGEHCLPLFHLAVYLCNGRRFGSGQRYLEQHLACRSDESTGPQPRGRKTGRKTQDRAQGQQQEEQQDYPQNIVRRFGGNGDQVGVENGGEPTAFASGSSIQTSSSTGPRLDVDSDAGQHPLLAQRLPGHTSATSTSGASTLHPGGASAQPVQGHFHGSAVDRMPTAELDRLGKQHAVSPMGSFGSHDEAGQEYNSEDGRGQDLARNQTSLLSCHLAVGEDLNPTTRNREEQPGQEHPSPERQRIVRILMNPGNICFANAFVVCQAWVTILAGALDPMWRPMGGFEFFRSVTTASVLPLNLLIFQPFLWLLTDGWTITDMDRQQDVAEFAHWFLMRTKPLFVNCEWVARFLRDGLEDEPSVRHEQGHRFGLISLHINPQLDTCSLQHLIELWHDYSGLCRAASKERRVILLHLSRFLPNLDHKCNQRVIFSNTVTFPCFIGDSADFHFKQYLVCGFVFHLGASPHSGHYRAAVRCRNQWLLYEDGTIPEKHVDLPDMALRNSVLFWLLPVDGISGRDAEALIDLRNRNIQEPAEAMEND